MDRIHGSLPRGLIVGKRTFALNIDRWAKQVEGRVELVVQKVAIDLLSSVIQMSPVGNPELWAANAGALYARANYNLFADAVGAPTLSKRALKAKFRLTAGKGYVGGRFKGNWQVRIGAPATGETGRVDPNGSGTLAAGVQVIRGAKADASIYITNNVRYALRLEYGWSKQAPGGMVGVTVTRFRMIVHRAVMETGNQQRD